LVFKVFRGYLIYIWGAENKLSAARIAAKPLIKNLKKIAITPARTYIS